MRQVGHRRTGTGSQLRGWRAEDGRGTIYSKSGITLALAVSFIHSMALVCQALGWALEIPR